MLKLLIRIAAFGFTIWCWRTMLAVNFTFAWSVAIMWGGIVFVPLVALGGRYLLDRRPELDRQGWVTAIIHYAGMILLGCPLMVGFRFCREYPIMRIPLPRYISQFFLLALGVFVTATILNLAIQGLGAPFAVVLSKKLANRWLYSRTRNPMLLGTLLLIVVLGFWLQSLHFVLWAAGWMSTAWVILVRVYEERELELRFGQSYLNYKRQTPFL